MNSEIRRELGRQLLDARKQKGFTQEATAGLLGITRPQLSDYENARVVYPTFEVLLKAAEVLETEFVLAGYKLTKQSMRTAAPPLEGQEKQLEFRFYKERTPKYATIRVSTVGRKVIIRAS